ncbi:MAG: GNAT family N-acetyltransferase [Ginsengibacter sp.]
MEHTFKRTATNDIDFLYLVSCLDNELWNELNEDQATYDQFNKVENISTDLLIYINDKPVGCGCFKKFNQDTAEIKRMFIQKGHRGIGLSKKLLHKLEQWAVEKDYRHAVLETSVHFRIARSLYENNGYKIIPNYPPYERLPESVCMKKELLTRIIK